MRAAVLASSVMLMLPGAWGHSATVIEYAHLPAGLAAWQRHSLGIYRVCGPLSKLLYALPAHLAGVRIDYPATLDSDIRSRREWDLGGIFQDNNREYYHNIYRWSRLVPILVTILGGCLVCEWSTRLFGARPGLLSLCVWCWMPPILAHGSLVTSDMLSAVLLVLAARSYWAFLLEPDPARAILAGVALGLAQVTKFTLLALYPCWALLLIGRAIQLRADDDGRAAALPILLRLTALGMLGLIISVLVIDSSYFFQDLGPRLAQLQPGFSTTFRDLQGLGERRAMAWLLRIPLPVPLEYLRGLDWQLSDVEAVQSTYLLGWTRLGGWWYWYAVASLIKIPIPALALLGLALARLPAALRGRDPLIWAALCLLLPAAEVTMVISATTGTGTSAAFRYLLPSLALLCVWVGAIGKAGSRVIRLTSIALLAWLAANAIVGAPDFLGWQNELGWVWSHTARRPALIGDSLDWGQDLNRLGQWTRRHSDEGALLACVYGLGAAEPYGLNAPAVLPMTSRSDSVRFVAVSSNILLGYRVDSCVSVGGEPSTIDETLRTFLLDQEPDDHVGRTIRIYRKTPRLAALLALPDDRDKARPENVRGTP